MKFRDTPIQRKVMMVMLLTSGAVLLLMGTAFFAYEFLTFRQTLVRQLSTLGEIIATNSTAALAFDDREGATEILAALQAEGHIVGVSLYDREGQLFAHYPVALPSQAFPGVPEQEGYRFEHGHLAGFQPVMQGGRRLGTLYLKSDMGAMYERFRLYGRIAALVLGLSFLSAYLLSRALRQQIVRPVLALAETARAVSERRDYSVRAEKLSENELGQLTDAFNHMLTQIDAQNQALREGAARLRAVLNAAHNAVMVIDAGGTITDWNDRAETIFGWRRTDAIGRELAETIIPPHYREAHRRGLKHFLATGEGPVLNQLIEMSALRRDGTEFPVELSISPLKTGDEVTFCGFITDITERKQAERALKRYAAELKRSNEELEQFAYVASHDLQEPLRKVINFTQLLARRYEGQLDEKADTFVAYIVDGATRMQGLINDLLTLSRVGTRGKAFAPTDLETVLNVALANLRVALEETGAEVTREALPTLMADGSQLAQLFQNLIGNAIKFRSDVPPGVHVGAECREGAWRFSVRDNGIGLAPEFAERIFVLFQRLHSQAEYPGTGIGLAICKKIVERHGGRIWVASQPGEGATFYFTIPVDGGPQS